MAYTEEEDRTHKERYKEAKQAAKKVVVEAKDIKDVGGRVLFRQEDIKMRGHQYFSQVLNETRALKEEIRQTSDFQRTTYHGSIINITTVKVGEAFKKIKG